MKNIIGIISLFLITIYITSCGKVSENYEDNIIQSSNDKTHGFYSKEFKREIQEIAENVDRIHSSKGNLLRLRNDFSQHDTDSCQFKESDDFSQVINYYLNEHFQTKYSQLAPDIKNIYKLTSEVYPVSLTSHALCLVSRESLELTLSNYNKSRNAKIPDKDTIERINHFAITHNRLRKQWSKQGDKKAKLQLSKHWTKLFYCLSYTESLSDPDTSRSYDVADKYAPLDYEKPSGVKFYIDSLQSKASVLNVGLFQFTPNSKGNIRSCLIAWNKNFPKCAIKNSSIDEMLRLMGSAKQHFNAFCGVNKLVQTFNVQVNTTLSRRTHPLNIKEHNLKAATDRCVSPHFYSSLAYNHFGPFQNSTGKNLEKLMKCVNKVSIAGL
jgi:hypothetical protein